MAKCPYCERNVGYIVLQEVQAGALFSDQWRAITYSCNHCQKILSVGIDPIALKTDTVEQVVEALFRRLRKG